MNLNSHITKFLVASVLSVTASGALSQDVTGQWRTEPGDDGGHLVVEISKCGNEICGTILDAINKDNQRISNYEYRGKQMIWGMRGKSTGLYEGGKIWAPDRNTTYNSKMELSENSLRVEGCVFVICRGQTWTKIN